MLNLSAIGIENKKNKGLIGKLQYNMKNKVRFVHNIDNQYNLLECIELPEIHL